MGRQYLLLSIKHNIGMPQVGGRVVTGVTKNGNGEQFIIKEIVDIQSEIGGKHILLKGKYIEIPLTQAMAIAFKEGM